ncbi:hypothetical protein BKA69DRAFT_1100708 [Paraphysoderma sedebokerense]|nr:hypothetical protein BKA69DRAFT_1100708 [Paraphysoderma sedebokerense]
MSEASSPPTAVAPFTSHHNQKFEPKTQEEAEERAKSFDKAIKEGAIRGAIIGGCLGASALLIGQRFSTGLKNLYVPYKAFLLTSGKSSYYGAHCTLFVLGTYFDLLALSAGFMIGGEQATFHSPASRYHYHEELMKQQEMAAELARPKRSWWNETRATLVENRYKITAWTWVGTVGTSLFMLYRNPHLSTSQKLVQTRVYAQGAVLLALLATAGLAAVSEEPEVSQHNHRFVPKPHAYPWEEDEQLKVPLHNQPERHKA